MPRSERRATAGFTLVETVMVIAITGTLAAVVALYIVRPVQAYLATAARSALVDQADLALRHMARELRTALPGSLRVNASGLALELIPTTGAARYATTGSGALDFGVLDTAFDLIGPPLTLSAGQDLVFYNLGVGVVGADAYALNTGTADQAFSNRRSALSTGSVSSVLMSSLSPLPALALAWPYRVTAVQAPVSYRCDLGTGTLTRHQGYGFLATQPDPPAGGQADVLAAGVSDCRFSVAATLVAAHAALVTLRLGLSTSTSAGTETATLHHALHVDNLP